MSGGRARSNLLLLVLSIAAGLVRLASGQGSVPLGSTVAFWASPGPRSSTTSNNAQPVGAQGPLNLTPASAPAPAPAQAASRGGGVSLQVGGIIALVAVIAFIECATAAGLFAWQLRKKRARSAPQTSVQSVPSKPLESRGSRALDELEKGSHQSGGLEHKDGKPAPRGPTRLLHAEDSAGDLTHHHAGGFVEGSDIHTGDIEICQRPDGSLWVLGEGNFGKVFRGLRGGMQDVAIKMLTHAGDVQIQQFRKEISILKKLSFDRNIVQFYGACLQAGKPILVLEYMEGGDLRQALCGKRGEELRMGRKGQLVALDIARGLHFLHSNKVMHSDLKTGNVLLTLDYRTAKIADVGLARIMHSEYTTQGCLGGTFAYAAPELLLNQRCSEKVDIYSFGVVLHEMLTQEEPKRGNLRDVKVPEECPASIAALLDACLDVDPARRPTAKQVFECIREAYKMKTSKSYGSLAAALSQKDSQLTSSGTSSSDDYHGHPALRRLAPNSWAPPGLPPGQPSTASSDHPALQRFPLNSWARSDGVSSGVAGSRRFPADPGNHAGLGRIPPNSWAHSAGCSEASGSHGLSAIPNGYGGLNRFPANSWMLQSCSTLEGSSSNSLVNRMPQEGSLLLIPGAYEAPVLPSAMPASATEGGNGVAEQQQTPGVMAACRADIDGAPVPALDASGNDRQSTQPRPSLGHDSGLEMVLPAPAATMGEHAAATPAPATMQALQLPLRAVQPLPQAAQPLQGPFQASQPAQAPFQAMHPMQSPFSLMQSFGDAAQADAMNTAANSANDAQPGGIHRVSVQRHDTF